MVAHPNAHEIKKYLKKWDSLENYKAQENALNKLFLKIYPNNTEIDEVLIKVSTLNDFYSTNIFSPYTVARHIIALKIDERLQAEDITLVEDITKVTMENGKTRNFYSFATKYCSRHKPLVFPLYDSYIDKVLRLLRTQDNFCTFKTNELKEYTKFNHILKRFREFYNLENYSVKDIDKYLWLLGREKLPNKY